MVAKEFEDERAAVEDFREHMVKFLSNWEWSDHCSYSLDTTEVNCDSALAFRKFSGAVNAATCDAELMSKCTWVTDAITEAAAFCGLCFRQAISYSNDFFLNQSWYARVLQECQQTAKNEYKAALENFSKTKVASDTVTEKSDKTNQAFVVIAFCTNWTIPDCTATLNKSVQALGNFGDYSSPGLFETFTQ